MPLINSEISLNLKRSEYCVITYTATRDAKADNTEIRVQKHPTFATTKIKLWVPVFNFSPPDNTILLQQWKTGFKGKNNWNKYRSEITSQAKNNKLIDPTFRKGNRLSVLSFENENCNISFCNISYIYIWNKRL